MENNKVIVVGTITEKYDYDGMVFGEIRRRANESGA